MNGSGKSTLLSLLPRFSDPVHGSVLVLGLDVMQLNLRSLRHNIGLVSQDTVLFDDTIHENIAYGCRSDRKSTRLHSSHTDISRMPSSA